MVWRSTRKPTCATECELQGNQHKQHKKRHYGESHTQPQTWEVVREFDLVDSGWNPDGAQRHIRAIQMCRLPIDAHLPAWRVAVSQHDITGR